MLKYGFNELKHHGLDISYYCGPFFDGALVFNEELYDDFQYNIEKTTPSDYPLRELAPTYSDLTANLARDRNTGRVFFTLVAKKEEDVVACVVMDCSSHTNDPLATGLFENYTVHHPAFNFCFPEIMPEFLDVILDVMPSCHYSSQFEIYGKEKSFILPDNFNYSFELKGTFEDYLTSLNKKHRATAKAVLIKNKDLTAKVSNNTVTTLMHNPQFIQSYMSNVNRQTHVFDDVDTTVAHINQALFNIKDPYIVEVLDFEGHILAYNIGELSSGVYIDKIAIPMCSEQVYKEKNIGLFCILSCISLLCENSYSSVLYYLDTGHGDYKRKFIPKDEDGNRNSVADYTSVSPEYINSKFWKDGAFKTPIHVKGTGWVMEDSNLPTAHHEYSNDIVYKEVDAAEYLAKYLNVFEGEVGKYETLEAGLNDTPRRYFLAMLTVDFAVGLCTFTQDDSLKCFYLENVQVSSAHRSQKIAESLLKHAVSKLKRSVYLHVNMKNAPALALYDKLGFIHITSVPNYYDEDEISGDEVTSAILLKLERY